MRQIELNIAFSQILAFQPNEGLLSPGSTSTNVVPTKERRWLQFDIGGRIHKGLPDTGVGPNVVTEDFAGSQGAMIDRGPDKLKTFTNALEKRWKAIGVTKMKLAFPDTPQDVMEHVFVVVKKCAAPLVLGREFLRATESFAEKNKHRLVKGMSHVTGAAKNLVFRLMHMEGPRQRLGVHVDGELVFANADSGADVDIASEDFARFMHWGDEIVKLPDDKGFVMLADGSVAKLRGYIDTEVAVRGISRAKRVYILPGLAYDLILGDETLDDFDVFEKHQDSFVDVDWEPDADVDDEFHVITWVEYYDAVEQDIAQVLQGRLPDANERLCVAPKRPSMARLFHNKVVGRPHSKIDRATRVRHFIQRRTQDLDRRELEDSASAKRRTQSLTGMELQGAEADDQNRRRKHQALRRRLYDLLSKVKDDGTIA